MEHSCTMYQCPLAGLLLLLSLLCQSSDNSAYTFITRNVTILGIKLTNANCLRQRDSNCLVTKAVILNWINHLHFFEEKLANFHFRLAESLTTLSQNTQVYLSPSVPQLCEEWTHRLQTEEQVCAGCVSNGFLNVSDLY